MYYNLMLCLCYCVNKNVDRNIEKGPDGRRIIFGAIHLIYVTYLVYLQVQKKISQKRYIYIINIHKSTYSY